MSSSKRCSRLYFCFFCFFSSMGFAFCSVSLSVELTRFESCLSDCFHYWDTCGSPVIKCLCFFVVFFFSSATKWKNCAIVPSDHWALSTMTTNCDPRRVKKFTCITLMMIDVVTPGQGRVTDEPRDFCFLNSFVSHFVFVLGLLLWRRRSNIFVYDYVELYGANAQNTYRRIHK